jgi:hypothetical protein
LQILASFVPLLTAGWCSWVSADGVGGDIPAVLLALIAGISGMDGHLIVSLPAIFPVKPRGSRAFVSTGHSIHFTVYDFSNDDNIMDCPRITGFWAHFTERIG